jgi:hypothetical protein
VRSEGKGAWRSAGFTDRSLPSRRGLPLRCAVRREPHTEAAVRPLRAGRPGRRRCDDCRGHPLRSRLASLRLDGGCSRECPGIARSALAPGAPGSSRSRSRGAGRRGCRGPAGRPRSRSPRPRPRAVRRRSAGRGGAPEPHPPAVRGHAASAGRAGSVRRAGQEHLRPLRRAVRRRREPGAGAGGALHRGGGSRQGPPDRRASARRGREPLLPALALAARPGRHRRPARLRSPGGRLRSRAPDRRDPPPRQEHHLRLRVDIVG